jgi:uncharacterized protein
MARYGYEWSCGDRADRRGGRAMRVFVMGGTGLVGTRLIGKLRDRGDQVMLLTRRAAVARDKFGEGVTVVEGDPMTAGPWMDRVEECDGVINLVGEGVFNRRWNEEFKKLLYDSRVKSTDHVVQALVRKPRTNAGEPKVLVNASAIGYYGSRGDEELTEESTQGDDVLARLCVDWEKAARAAESDGVRVAVVRVGVVLDRTGGALKQMVTPFKMFIGGPIGSGKQWMSWIHHEDVVGIFLLGLDHAEARGPLNGTAPNPVTNKVFSKALGGALGRPSFMPTPKFGLRVMLGEVAGVVAGSQRVLPKKPLALGYAFRFPEVDAALRDAVG